jgi:membrane associated rhomboid family serine protease
MTGDDRPPREPMFNAPWQAVSIPLALLVAYGVQTFLLPNAVLARLAMSPAGVANGEYLSLITYMFVHAGLMHLIMNGAAAFAFGPPVARFLGQDGPGTAAFFGLFIFCGVLSGLGYIALHWGSPGLVVGASGAISGLWGAASRLLVGRGSLAPIFCRPVLLQAAVFAVINLAIGLLGGFAGFGIAWEAHIFGYAAGLLLIGSVRRMLPHG